MTASLSKYVAVGPFGGRKFVFFTDCTLKLRRRCREYIGLRRSAKMRYKQIGANSFRVENWRGCAVLDVYKDWSYGKV